MTSRHAARELPLAWCLRVRRHTHDSDSDSQRDTCRERQRFSDEPKTYHFPSLASGPVSGWPEARR